MVPPSAQREAVAHLQVYHGMRERRACRVIDADLKSVRYRSQRGADAEIREKPRELANERRRLSYRLLHILLRWDGVMINRKKTQRLYREEGLAVRRRRSRRRAIGARAQAPVLALPSGNDTTGQQLCAGSELKNPGTMPSIIELKVWLIVTLLDPGKPTPAS